MKFIPLPNPGKHIIYAGFVHERGTWSKAGFARVFPPELRRQILGMLGSPRSPLLETGVMSEYLHRVAPSIRQFEDLPDVQQRTAWQDRFVNTLIGALNEFTRAVGLPAVQGLEIDDKHDREGAYREGVGRIELSEEVLYYGNRDGWADYTAQVLYHELTHFEQDCAIIKAIAQIVLRLNENPNQSDFRKIKELYERIIGNNLAAEHWDSVYQSGIKFTMRGLSLWRACRLAGARTHEMRLSTDYLHYLARRLSKVLSEHDQIDSSSWRGLLSQNDDDSVYLREAVFGTRLLPRRFDRFARCANSTDFTDDEAVEQLAQLVSVRQKRLNDALAMDSERYLQINELEAFFTEAGLEEKMEVSAVIDRLDLPAVDAALLRRMIRLQQAADLYKFVPLNVRKSAQYQERAIQLAQRYFERNADLKSWPHHEDVGRCLIGLALSYGGEQGTATADLLKAAGLERLPDFKDRIISITDGMSKAAPDNLAVGYERRGNNYSRIGDYPAAMSDLNRAVDLEPDNDNYLYSRAMVLFSIASYDLALVDLGKVVSSDSSWRAGAHRLAGVIYTVHEKWDQAVDEFDQSLKLEQSLSSSYLGRGLVYLKLGNISSALEDLRQALNGIRRRSDIRLARFVAQKLYEAESSGVAGSRMVKEAQ